MVEAREMNAEGGGYGGMNGEKTRKLRWSSGNGKTNAFRS